MFSFIPVKFNENMKKYFFGICTCIALQSCAQKESYDLLRFNPLPGWEKSSNTSAIGFTAKQPAKKAWCTISLYKSVPGTNDIETDFLSEWQELTVRNNTITTGPQKEPAVLQDGWQVMAGGGKGKFNKEEMMVVHTVASGYGVKMSVIAKTNHADYLPQIESFISSIEWKKPESATSGILETKESNTTPALTNFIFKSYQNRQHASGMGDNAGRSTNTYTFNNNGTYTFTNVTFQYNTPKYYLVNETGTYALKGTTLLLQPTKSRWSIHKSRQTDPVLRSGKNELTSTTFRIEFVTIYERLRLVLSPIDGKENKRDGSFDYVNNNVLQKAYLYDAEDKVIPANNLSTESATGSATTVKMTGLKEIWMSVNQVARNTYNYATNRYQYTYDFKPIYYVVYENGNCLDDLPLFGPGNPAADAKWGKFQLGATKGFFTDANGKSFELEKLTANELKLKGRIEKHYRCVPVDGLKLDGWYSVNASRTKKEISPGGTYHRETGGLFYFDKKGSFDDPGLFVKNKENPNAEPQKAPGKGTYSISNFTIYLKYTDGRSITLSFTGFNGDNPFVKDDIVYMSSFPLYKVKE